MRLYEFTGTTIEEMLAEIDRRGFLKGLGAAAATAANLRAMNMSFDGLTVSLGSSEA